jgi:predicted dehydrogenase
LKVPEALVVALVDPSDEQIHKTHEAHPILAPAAVYNDYKKMLETEQIDAVMIATPHTQHVDQILDSFAAGAHVCCEKPLVTSVADAHRVIEARDKAGKVGMVSYQRHFHAEYRFIRDKIKSGEAGKFQFVSSMLGQGWLRATKGTWRQEMALSGGGQLNDSGSHVLDIILWMSGTGPETVCAFTENFESEVDINSALSVRFRNGGLGAFSVIGNGFDWRDDVSIFCENMVFYMRDGKLTMIDRKENKLVAEHLGGGSSPDQHFIDCILACPEHSLRGRAECDAPFECGLEVIRLTEAAWQSAANGGEPVHVA